MNGPDEIRVTLTFRPGVTTEEMRDRFQEMADNLDARIDE